MAGEATLSDLASRPRLLLRRLHQVMAGPGDAQARLDQVVRVIAQNMVSEVCSVYLARAGQVLELFATQGLKQEAVHQTRLRFGEGLVGLVAERGLPLNLPEASTHPKFVYRPETGEEIYHSLLGVPIVRGGRVAGVLVVQNVTQREYDAEEVEALQTVAMVLAELLGTGELVDPDELTEAGAGPAQSLTLDGVVLAEGVAAGTAVFHEPPIEVTTLVAEDVEFEKQRLRDAFTTMRDQLERIIAAPDLGMAGEHREVLEAYRMFAYDRGWQERIREAVDSGLTAEAAIERVQQRTRARLMSTQDPYLRERLTDLDHLADRLIRVVMGKVADTAHDQLPEDAIVVARSLGPAELLEYDRRRLKAVVLEEGSPTAHVAIIARAMGIPMIGRLPSALHRIQEGDHIIVDGEAGHVFIRPTEDIAETYRDNIAVRQARAAEYVAQRELPTVTRDGVEVDLYMNAGLLVDLPHLEATGADGIGLFRTEFQFMVGSTLPRLETQRDLYGQVMDAAGGRPVLFRTLDIGGDKAVPFLPRDHEENPAMGWRAIRVALDRPALLRYQLRALLYAAEGRDLNVMFPMIADVSEFRGARTILDKEVRRLERLGRPPPSRVRVGTMLEVPSLAWQLETLLKDVDFVSIGTNDLMQFFFASDRANPRLADRYDLLSPAALSFIRSVVESCERAGVPVGLCGEMGGRPLEAMALVGLGLRRLSISPSAIGPVKMMIRSLDTAELRQYLVPALQSPEHSLRRALWNFARDHGVIL